MKITVEDYNEHWRAHHCMVEGGQRAWIDLTIDHGIIPKGINPAHLIGMEFDIRSMCPFVSIASGIK
jgi:hypothetical protein